MAARDRRAAKEIDEAVRTFAEAQPWATYFTARECAQTVGCGESTAKRRLTRLVECGLLASSPRHGYAMRGRQDAATRAPAAACEPALHVGLASVDEILTVFARDPKSMLDFDGVAFQVKGARDSIKSQLDALTEDGDLVCEDGWYHWPTIEDAKTAPASPPAPAPVTTEPDPEPPADPPAADSPPVMPPAFAGIETASMEVSWLKTDVAFCHSRELRVITDLEEMEDGERERVLTYAVDRW